MLARARIRGKASRRPRTASECSYLDQQFSKGCVISIDVSVRPDIFGVNGKILWLPGIGTGHVLIHRKSLFSREFRDANMERDLCTRSPYEIRPGKVTRTESSSAFFGPDHPSNGQHSVTVSILEIEKREEIDICSGIQTAIDHIEQD